MVSHFDVVSIKDLLTKVAAEKEKLVSYGTNFKLFGYESTYTVINYGDTFLVIIIFIAMFLVYNALYFILNKIHKFKG